MVKTSIKWVIHTENGIVDVVSNKDETVLEVIRRYSIFLDAPCGGKGVCGKCRVRIASSGENAPQPRELEILDSAEIESGIRLACMTLPVEGMELFLYPEGAGARILTRFSEYRGELDPPASRINVELPPASITDQRDDLSRFRDSIDIETDSIPLELIKQITAINPEKNGISALFWNKRLIALEKETGCTEDFGIAVDIGTTTVVAYLLDLNSGKIVDNVSELNSQKLYGADVISRIEYSRAASGNLGTLFKEITDQLQGMVLSLINKAGIDRDRIHSLVLAGNTTMIHLALGLDPAKIAVAPFIPSASEYPVVSARELNININKHLVAAALPSISGYIGSDILAGILAVEMHKSEELSLLVDIGTNGEIVLGNSQWLLSCSTAAGPAFEGAHIAHGLGGVPGSINEVSLENGKMCCTVIDDIEAAGICGSGLVDLVAILLESGLVEASGRMLELDEIGDNVPPALRERMLKKGDNTAFLISGTEENGIWLYQKDIREVQLAKASIQAGILTLLNEKGLKITDIKRVLLAGGFGNYLRPESAVRLGLLPAELRENIEMVGNSAGNGAVISSFSKKGWEECRAIKENAGYLELSANTDFRNYFMECMMFPLV